MMLRRFEIYSIEEGAPAGALELLRRSCRDCGRHIPEVLHSAVGENLSATPVQLAWEHAYESPAAYRRYMVHPFHASVLDRFLLADSPERLTTSNDLGLGLAGYEVDAPTFVLGGGLRRLLFLDLGQATSEEIGQLAAEAVRAAGPEVPEMAVSVFAENSMATRWFDGETVMAPAPRWTHIWEQGFVDEEAWAAHLASGRLLADAEGNERRPVAGLAEVAVVRYRLDPAAA